MPSSVGVARNIGGFVSVVGEERAALSVRWFAFPKLPWLWLRRSQRRVTAMQVPLQFEPCASPRRLLTPAEYIDPNSRFVTIVDQVSSDRASQ
jgi:hypothetical protein